MLTSAASVRSEIIDLIRQTVRESTLAYGFRDVTVRAGEDHDGDPVLFVESAYDLTDEPIDTKVTAALTTRLRDKLWAAGETRFPHLRHKFDENQKVKPRRRAGV
jgi:hypothetical protein